MSATIHCPQCGAPLPLGALEGLCPACLLKQAATTDVGLAGDHPSFTPLPVEEVARLFPQLEVIELIGKGGMGAIYKARQPALDRFVALKILPPPRAGGPNFAERFNREARALARLNHPHIVTLHEFGQVERLHYFLMEFVDGANLRQLEQHGRLAPREALQIVPQICDALQYAHDQGVVHRDIKPENVLIDRKGRVKIADFGLAKILDPDPAALRLTGEGQVMGTPHYMAPEQVEHPLAVDHRADIYALGVVFYEMLTGELPLGKFAPPSGKVQLDVRLDEVVLRALEKEPERRYQQASQVKSAVETVATGPQTSPAPAAPAAALGPTWTQRLRYRIWPPLVVRCHGERKVNWPAVAMRGTRALFSAVWLAVLIGLGFGLSAGSKTGWAAGFIQFGIIFVLTSFLLVTRVLRGLAVPLELLPDFDHPLTPRPVRRPDSRRSARAAGSGLAVFLVVLAVATVITLCLPQSYLSLARVRLEKTGQAMTLGADPIEEDPYFIQTECAVMRSQRVLEPVIEHLHLAERWTQRYKAKEPISSFDLIKLLTRSLDIRQTPNTKLIEIRSVSEVPAEAAEIANAIAETYQTVQTNSHSEVVDRAEPAIRPVRPNLPLNLALAAVLGTLLGLATAGMVYWMRPRRDQGTKGPRDQGTKGPRD